MSALQSAHKAASASLFAIPLGLVALGLAWQTAASIWSVPNWVWDTLIWAGATLWAFLLIAYLGKWLLRTADAKAELEDPVQSCFFGLAGVVALLASIGLLNEYRALSLGLYVFGVAWALVFGIYQTGRLWMGDRKLETNTPILYLPIVAGGFVTASAAAAIGYIDWGRLAFGGAASNPRPATHPSRSRCRAIYWLLESDPTPAWWNFSFGALRSQRLR